MLTELAADPSVRVTEGGRVLIGGSPLRVLRLTEAGARVVADVVAGRPVDGDGRPAVERLLDRLVDAGFVHPRPSRGPFTAADVAVVIPARGRTPRLAPTSGGPAVVVVDDGSDPPLRPLVGATVLRRPASGGPAAARNTGWRTVAAPLVAFVDADCTAGAGWLDPLLPHFADPRVAAVAPRIASEPGPGAVAAYEEQGSPLDLGPLEGRVAPMTRLAYVPATAIVVRRAALEELGGFAEDLRFGEDVDLVWRLVEAGHRVRYDPRSVVSHEPRRSWGAWARQRFDYGTSAGPLAVRHPGALAPVAVSGWSALAWGLVAARRPAAGLAVAGATTALLARKLSALEDGRREALRLGLLGHLHAGRALAQAVTRAWLPLACVAAVPSRTARRALLGAVAARTLVGDGGRPTHRLLRLADDAAYCAGVWVGCWRARTPEPLRPALGSWPGRTPVPEPAGTR